MSYRPQFAFEPPPPGWEDVDFEYVFSPENTPAMNVPLFPGDTLLNVVLPLEPDAEYRVRSIEFIDPSLGGLGVRFRDAYGVLLSPLPGFVRSSSYTRTGAAVPLEPELVCPAGSVLQVDLKNLL
jgi:hypothetical protein